MSIHFTLWLSVWDLSGVGLSKAALVHLEAGRDLQLVSGGLPLTAIHGQYAPGASQAFQRPSKVEFYRSVINLKYLKYTKVFEIQMGEGI